MAEPEDTLQRTGQALRESARMHKRAASSHRRQARKAMQELDRLERVCSEMGIKLVITQTTKESE